MIYCKHPFATISPIATTIYSRYFKNPWKLEQLFLSFYRLLQWINYYVYPKTLCVHVCHTFLHAINRLFCCCCSEISRFLCFQKLFFSYTFFFFVLSFPPLVWDRPCDKNEKKRTKNSSLTALNRHFKSRIMNASTVHRREQKKHEKRWPSKWTNYCWITG